MTEWHEHQEFESGWWGHCANTLGEEQKQIVYARLMGLVAESDRGHWPAYDLGGKSVVDLGGGPVSMLLKSLNGGLLTVVDPCTYPRWVKERYHEVGIEYVTLAAEHWGVDSVIYDEAWIYNVLQHVMDPAAVVAKACQVARKVRLFEWINIPASIGHPHVLTAPDLRKWLNTKDGFITDLMAEHGGFAFSGVFEGDQP